MQLKYTTDNFSSSPRPKNHNKKDEKDITFKSVNELPQGRQMLINAIKSGIFPIKKTLNKK